MEYKVTNPLLCTRKEAEDVLRRLDNTLEEYGCVTVEDLYDLVCMLDDFRGERDSYYGWTCLRAADIRKNDYEGAYEICMPRAIPLALGYNIHQPKTIAEIDICGAVHLCIDDTMNFIKPTPEQIKNLHDMLCIDVTLYEEDSE